MTLTLTLERSPRSQAVRQMQLAEGELVIGRGAEADWRIDDPDMFVSRAHCKIVVSRGRPVVTDTSSGGLFVDGSRTPLGMGNTMPLHDGARLQLGDYVVRVDMQAAQSERVPERPIVQAPVSFEKDSFFSTVSEPAPTQPRPTGLPDPFEQPVRNAYVPSPQEPKKAAPLFDDLFSLDPQPSRAVELEEPQQPTKSTSPSRNNNWDPFFSEEPSSRQIPEFVVPTPTLPDTAPVPMPEPQKQQAFSEQPKASPPSQPDSDELLAAFLRGLGFRADELPVQDPLTRMESFGREYKLMLEGMIHLLRKRAEEKGEARVAQTIVGASEVNPLKFLPTVDDVIATFLTQRQAGFLPPEAAIANAIRDLAHHHVQTWRGVQSALGRMLDRFDPAALERELKSQSAWDALLAGGKRAKLWELYEKRYREIAKSASTRFLGEIGSDFRDGYEEREKE